MKKKKEINIKKIRFIFDEYRIDLDGINRKSLINLMGLPIEFKIVGDKLVVVDLSHWLLGVYSRIYSIFHKPNSKRN